MFANRSLVVKSHASSRSRRFRTRRCPCLCLLMGLLGSFLFFPGTVRADDQPAPQQEAKRTAKVVVPANVVFHADLVYAKAGAIRLELDLALPKDGQGPYPAVIILHGTGLITKARLGVRGYALALAQHGFAAVAVGFRHDPKHAYPAALDDVYAASRPP